MTALEAPYVVEVITVVPKAWPGYIAEHTGLVGRAFAAGLTRLTVSDLRDFGAGPHRKVDDAPFGGGAGMVLKAPPLKAAIARARARTPGPVIMLAPRGRRMHHQIANTLAQQRGMTLVCGRYEGIDERAFAWVDEVISVGDFIVSGGDVAALSIIDAVVRLLPGVIGNALSLTSESFVDGLLEYPHYTRPLEVDGVGVPEVLRCGDHKKIATWRKQQAELLTHKERPELLQHAKKQCCETL